MAELNVKTNLPDFKQQLSGFSADFEKRAVRSAGVAAGNVLKKLAIYFAPILNKFDRRRHNPRVPGDLKRAIYSGRSKRKSRRGVEVIQVGFRSAFKKTKAGKIKGGAFYGRFLEGGWLPRGPGRKLKGGTRSRAMQRLRNIRGGAKKVTKYAFIAPAFAAGQGAALAAFQNRIALRISVENAKR